MFKVFGCGNPLGLPGFWVGREGVNDKVLPMGRDSVLVGLRPSSHSLGQLALAFRGLCRISWRS